MAMIKRERIQRPEERIILPLDFPSFQDARPFIVLLKDHVGLFKIGLTLFMNEGLEVVKKVEAVAPNRKIFLDLKLYDTPWQVGGAVAALVSKTKAIRFVTVHSSGGARVLRAAVEAMDGKTGILGVTVLTSMNASELSQVGIAARVEDQVLALAGLAKAAGAVGVVASAHEVSSIRKTCGKNFLIVTPGIRPSWSQISNDDQRRMMTPAEAVTKGADYLVVGRPIISNKDPIGAAMKIADEIEAASAP
ncbi:orotidine-5'-phosphate decarboxylase [bacterium AH-315-L15]|nr:orotidine-5'-phosphate decarboxylase [bacterium AH-315-L15]